jgi:hypothetical protein
MARQQVLAHQQVPLLIPQQVQFQQVLLEALLQEKHLR